MKRLGKDKINYFPGQLIDIVMEMAPCERVSFTWQSGSQDHLRGIASNASLPSSLFTKGVTLDVLIDKAIERIKGWGDGENID